MTGAPRGTHAHTARRPCGGGSGRTPHPRPCSARPQVLQADAPCQVRWGRGQGTAPETPHPRLRPRRTGRFPNARAAFSAGPCSTTRARGEPCTSRARAATANNGAPPCALRGSDQASRSGDCSLGTGLAGPWGHGRWRLCVPQALRALHLGASQPLPRISEFRPGPFRSHAPCDASPDGGEHLRSSPSACWPAPQHQHVRLTHTGWLCRDRTQVWCLQTQEAGAGALVAASDPVPQRLWREGRTQAPRPPGPQGGARGSALWPCGLAPRPRTCWT